MNDIEQDTPSSPDESISPSPTFAHFDAPNIITPALLPLRAFILSNISFVLTRPVSDFNLILDVARSLDVIRYRITITTISSPSVGTNTKPTTESILQYHHTFLRVPNTDVYTDLKFEATLEEEAKTTMEKLWSLSHKAVAKKLAEAEPEMQGKWKFEGGKLVENTDLQMRTAMGEKEEGVAGTLLGMVMILVMLCFVMLGSVVFAVLFSKLLIWMMEVTWVLRFIRWVKT